MMKRIIIQLTTLLILNNKKIRVITLECYDRMFDFGFSAELVNWLGKTALNFF